ncbi:hypothetical protein DPX16_21354 [Anabarilius grahami]|uniref:Uncharacterized protein n=1 Tax=Anabarilius grahami TaxID=495550 RepID=A0A3N0XEM8_ANAGA|nr:hypothetical protein DPX16_21354 [Anabarilius grahami]
MHRQVDGPYRLIDGEHVIWSEGSTYREALMASDGRPRLQETNACGIRRVSLAGGQAESKAQKNDQEALAASDGRPRLQETKAPGDQCSRPRTGDQCLWHQTGKPRRTEKDNKMEADREGSRCIRREIKAHCVGRVSLAGRKKLKRWKLTGRALAASDGRSILMALDGKLSFSRSRWDITAAAVDKFSYTTGRLCEHGDNTAAAVKARLARDGALAGAKETTLLLQYKNRVGSCGIG